MESEDHKYVVSFFFLWPELRRDAFLIACQYLAFHDRRQFASHEVLRKGGTQCTRGGG